MKYLRKVSDQQVRASAGVEVEDKDLRKECPALAEYLYSVVDPDGKPRKTGTITIFIQDGRVKAFFTDKEAEVQIGVTADTLWDAIRALDECLQGDEPPWRKWTPWEGNGKASKGNRR